MINAGHFGKRDQESADLHGIVRALTHAYRQRACAAYCKPCIVGADRITHGVMRVIDALGECRVVHHDCPKHQVGMTGHVLGASHHRNIGAQLKRTIDVAGPPGVVHDQDQIVLTGEFGQCRDIKHFKQQRAGRLHIQNLGVQAQLRFQIGRRRAAIRDLDTHAVQYGLIQVAHRSVGTIGDQDVVAAIQDAEKGQGNGTQAGRRQKGALRAFQRTEHVLQRGMRVHSAAAIRRAALPLRLRRLRAIKRIQVGEPHGARAHGRQGNGRRAGNSVKRRHSRMLKGGI